MSCSTSFFDILITQVELHYIVIHAIPNAQLFYYFQQINKRAWYNFWIVIQPSCIHSTPMPERISIAGHFTPLFLE